MLIDCKSDWELPDITPQTNSPDIHRRVEHIIAAARQLDSNLYLVKHYQCVLGELAVDKPPEFARSILDQLEFQHHVENI
jgi:hypothetical protein